MNGEGGSGRGQRGGGGGGGFSVPLETKSIAEEVKERNRVEDSSHTNTLHTTEVAIYITENVSHHSSVNQAAHI